MITPLDTPARITKAGVDVILKDAITNKNYSKKDDIIEFAKTNHLLIFSLNHHIAIAKTQINDPANAKIIKQIKSGKNKAINSLIGKIMSINKYQIDGDWMKQIVTSLVENDLYIEYTDDEIKRWT